MESTFVILFSIASLVAIVVRRTRVPYTVALVIVGLIVGGLHVVEAPHLTKALLFALFLPGLVFEAAYNIRINELRTNWRTITMLAVPGVLAVIGVTAASMLAALRILQLAPDLTWRDGLVFAALVAATDPIAVVALFRKLGVSPRLTTVIEAESLFNDGTSIVALSLVLSYVTGAGAGIAVLSLQFLAIIGGGALVGALFGVGLARVTKHLDDPMIEITLTTIAAYGSFVTAERLHLSGVIATVSAGLILGTYGRDVAMSPATRVSADAFWEYVAFALNSIVFLLIGFEVRPAALLVSAEPIVVAFIAVVVARFGIVAAVMAALRSTSERFSVRWAALMAWGGLRGALSMVLALSLPTSLSERGLLINLTFGVVLLSLLLQGLTLPSVAERLAEPSAASTTER